MAPLLHLVAWLGIYAIWFLATRDFHPTLSLSLLATATLVSASAAAVYINGLALLPRFAGRGSWGEYIAALLGTVILLDLFAVLVIQFLYDQIRGPDPLRFGFWFNMASDGFIIIVHVAAAAGVTRIVRALRSGSAG